MVDGTYSVTQGKTGFWRRPSRSLLPALRRRRTAIESESATHIRSAIGIMVIAFAVFAVFDTEGIRHFARDLPGNAASDLFVAAADRWHALMVDLGPARIGPAVREAFEQFRQIRW